MIINFFAGPGAGKSTTAAGLFHRMKKDGKSVELVTEYAKTRVWEEHYKVFQDQLYISAKQARAVNRLVGKVDYIITDSPICIGMFYSEDNLINEFIFKYFNRFDNLNFFIERTKPYVETGRNETQKQAKEIDKKIINTIPNLIKIKDDEHILINLYRHIFKISQ